MSDARPAFAGVTGFGIGFGPSDDGADDFNFTGPSEEIFDGALLETGVAGLARPIGASLAAVAVRAVGVAVLPQQHVGRRLVHRHLLGPAGRVDLQHPGRVAGNDLLTAQADGAEAPHVIQQQVEAAQKKKAAQEDTLKTIDDLQKKVDQLGMSEATILMLKLVNGC